MDLRDFFLSKLTKVAVADHREAPANDTIKVLHDGNEEFVSWNYKDDDKMENKS